MDATMMAKLRKSYTYDEILISTCDRQHRNIQSTFCVGMPALNRLLEYNPTRILLKDSGSFMEAEHNDDLLSFTITWLTGNAHLHGYEQSFSLSVQAMIDFLQGETDTHAFLVQEQKARAALDFSRANHVLHNILQDERAKYAFNKGIERCFKYKYGGTVYFSGDSAPYSFGFYHDREDGRKGYAGCFLCEKVKDTRHPSGFSYEYSTHT